MIISLLFDLSYTNLRLFFFYNPMEEFGLENHFDGFKKMDEDLKKDSKIMYRESLFGFHPKFLE